MKRHEAIAPLSRDHHGALILAHLLKKNAPLYKGLPANTKDKIEYAQQQFEMHIKKHFQQEEMILDKLRGVHEDIDKLSEEIRQEHQHLTNLFNELNTAPDREEAMDLLGETLKTHIRKEERVLFPLLQQHCTEEMLDWIYMLLH